MASLRRFPRSPYWFACFTMKDGRRVQRSTKERLRRKAQQIADEWEELARTGAQARQVQKVVADIYRAAHAKELPAATVRGFLSDWLVRRKGELAPSSFAAYSGRAKDFLEWLKDVADGPLVVLETSHFTAYRNALAERRSTTTANHGVKLLRVMFEDARRDGFLPENPAKDCGLLKRTHDEGVSRRPFTVDELRTVLELATGEWRSLILFGLYTGQRLGDLARLTWSQIDMVANEIHFRTRKTGRVVRVPIVGPLAAHLASMEAGDGPAVAVHPKAAAIALVNSSTLSRQFSELLAASGLAERRTHEAGKQGRSARRTASALSFHSLRHTATSLMKNAGVSPAIVQDIIGHDSAEMSAHYTKIESEAKRHALGTLPDLVGG
jgi:integrase